MLAVQPYDSASRLKLLPLATVFQGAIEAPLA